MGSHDISVFPGLYRLDPVQSAIRCDPQLMASAEGVLCGVRHVKTPHLADVESRLFGISRAGESSPVPIPVPSKPFRHETQGPSEEQHRLLVPSIRPRGAQRGVPEDRFIRSYPTIPVVAPDHLYVGGQTRELYKQ